MTHAMINKPWRMSRIVMPALDFIRALNERPWIVRLLCRLFMGRSAYREFMFMVTIFREEGYDPVADYNLHDHEYHKERQPWRWWLGILKKP